MRATTVIPFHSNLQHLGRALPAARRASSTAEVLVADGGALNDCRPVAMSESARVTAIRGSRGPATGRNRAAVEASGHVLLFADHDVIALSDSLSGMYRLLEQQPGGAAIFGAYDADAEWKIDLRLGQHNIRLPLSQRVDGGNK